MRRLLSFVLLSLLLAACTSGTVSTGEETTPVEELPFAITNTLPAGTFARQPGDGFSGDLTVRGYAEIENVQEAFCEQNCNTYQYVFVKILETGNAALPLFLTEFDGNSYVQEDAIGIGCLEGEVIRFENATDEQQMVESSISPDATRMIQESSKRNPILLKLTKKQLSGGSEAPSCYSHFSTIEVVRTPR